MLPLFICQLVQCHHPLKMQWKRTKTFETEELQEIIPCVGCHKTLELDWRRISPFFLGQLLIECLSTVLLVRTLFMASQRMVLLLTLEQYQHFDHLLTDFQLHILMSSTLSSMKLDASVWTIFVSPVIPFLYMDKWSLFSILILSENADKPNIEVNFEESQIFQLARLGKILEHWWSHNPLDDNNESV